MNAGGTHNDEMCNMYTMVYGKTPYLTMCDNNVQVRAGAGRGLRKGSQRL